MRDMNDEDPMTSIKMLTGLLDKEYVADLDLFQNLVNTMIALSHQLPSQKLNGETFSDELKRREKQGKPSTVYLSHTTLPPTGWLDYYYKAMFYMSKQQFFKASEEFDKTFEKLLETKTTSNDIYRVFCNSGMSYLCSGNPVLGVQCFEVASKLNPQYAFASEQLEKYNRGDFDGVIHLGVLTQIKQNLEQWTEKHDRLNVDIVMKWSERKILNKLLSFGVTVDKEEFVNVARTVNQPEKLAKKLFSPQVRVETDDEDFVWMAAYALWNIYCPNEPSICDFNDVLHEAFSFISKTKRKNKRTKMTQEAIKKTSADYFTDCKHIFFLIKKIF
jgi:tetratricopeptide (TPR) repeat protein